MTATVPTGSVFLDGVLGGGIPRGASVVLQGPPGEEKETIAWRFLKAGWDRGEAAIVALSSMSPRRLYDRLASMGIDARALEKSGRLVIVDWFSQREEAITDVREDGAVLKVSVDLTNVGVAINWALNRIRDGVSLRAVLEVLSPALVSFDLRQVCQFAQATKAKLEKRDATALFLIEREMHDSPTLSNIQQPFDGVIDIERTRAGDRIVRKIGVPAMRGPQTTSTRYIAFDLETTEAPRGVQPAAEPFRPEVVSARSEPVGPVDTATSSETGRGDEKFADLARAADAILAREPRNLDALFAKSATLAHSGRWQDALAVLNDVTRLDVRYPGVWVLKAKVFEHLGKPKMAASCLERAIELHGTERVGEVGPALAVQKVRASSAARSSLA